MSLNHNQLQKPIVMRLSLSAETAVYKVSFLSTAPLLMLFLSLGCLFINCRNQISTVFIYQPIPQSMNFLSFLLNHTYWRVFLLDVSSSWMFVSKLQGPKYTVSRMAYNG